MRECRRWGIRVHAWHEMRVRDWVDRDVVWDTDRQVRVQRRILRRRVKPMAMRDVDERGLFPESMSMGDKVDECLVAIRECHQFDNRGRVFV